MHLHGLQILVTRPKEQSLPLYNAICQQGGKPILFPTIATIPLIDKEPLLQAIASLDEIHYALFISANAVKYTMKYWPSKQLPHLQIAAIGPATANALIPFNTKATIVPSHTFNSEALLELLPASHIMQKNIIIFSGQEGRQLLYNTLSERGANVQQIAVYQRILPQNHQLPTNKMDIIISTSEQSLNNLFQLMKDNKYLTQTPLLVVSERISDLAKNLGFSHIIIASNATDKALLQSLIHWKSERRTA